MDECDEVIYLVYTQLGVFDQIIMAPQFPAQLGHDCCSFSTLVNCEKLLVFAEPSYYVVDIDR